jgi:hypothetical protein
VLIAMHEAADDAAAPLPRDFAQEGLGHATVGLGGDARLKAEPRGKHLRQHDERSRRGAALSQELAHALEVRLLVLPGAIELHEMHGRFRVHRARRYAERGGWPLQ